MINPHNYTISIRRDEFDGEVCFEARVKELPDLTDYADSYEEAYELAIDSIETTMEIFAEKNRPMPMPIVPVDNFSGRVTLRLPKSLHRVLANTSKDEGVSLNQYLCNVLSYFSGFSNKPEKVLEEWSPVERKKSRPNLRVIGKEDTWLKKAV